MKKNIKLLLLAALAWPGWTAIVAQETPIAEGITINPVSSELPIGPEQQLEVKKMTVKSASKTTSSALNLAPRKKADPNAPAIFVQTDHEVTICNGTSTNEYVPLYVYFFDDDNTSSQFIYPKSLLGDLPAGSPINSVTFYANSALPTEVGSADIEVRIGEVPDTTITTITQSTMASNRNSNYMTLVYSGKLSYDDKLLTITFSTPYTYNGGNLIIDTKVISEGSYTHCSWYGIDAEQGSSIVSYYYRWQRYSQQSFLPKMTINYLAWKSAEEVDFGAVLLQSTKEISARINNPGEETLTANMSATQPFGVNPATLTMNPGLTDFTLSFTPSQAINYSGNLNLEINGQSANVGMTGVGFKAGEKAVRDEAFFHNITYDWTDSNGKPHTSTLDSIATDPDQIIAMLREVYTNQNIPGNFERGYTSDGEIDVNNEADHNVQYAAPGKLAANGNGVYFDDCGWNILPGVDDIIEKSASGGSYYQYGYDYSYQYFYLNPEQFKPKYEGVTLLLLEMVDDFKPSQVNVTETGYEGLKKYVEATIKSVRVVTAAKRTGEGKDAGTLFKIDCDRMNKFYLIAKGQLQWFRSVMYDSRLTYLDFYKEPCFVNGWFRYNDNGVKYLYNDPKFVDPGLDKQPFILGHMFEQFSPALSNSTVTKSDIYQELAKNMESFGVDHDCPNVPFVENGHHFMMYDEDSSSDDCQDVRDMMFFVPDFRMMDHEERSTWGLFRIENGDTIPIAKTQDYFKYNPAHKPTMGMFVIVQNEIPQGEICGPNNSLYKHQLEWKSSLNKFLPSDDQYYELWEVVINAYGIEEYVPVYERNADGSYVLDENGEKKQVILNRSARFGSDDKNNDILHYLNVYVDRKEGSQTKTYVIRGRDKGDENGEPFLSLEMSNRQSIVIPGLDPNEKVRMIGTTHYSRYNPKDETNCYSNKLQIVDNSLTEDDLAGNVTFTRSCLPALVDENGNVQTDEDGNILYATEAESVTFATGSYSNGTLTITINPETQAASDKFPEVKNKTGEGFDRYLDVAGYHANPVDGNNQMTIDVEIKDGKVSFTDFKVWDNFTADVSENKHPYRYLYKIYMGGAYSNDVPVMVYKTDSKINGAVTLQDVLDDSDMGLPTPGDVEFQAQVQFGSKTELLRYDAYRWQEYDDKRYIVTQVGVNEYGNDIETDVAPDGQANNESSYYTVRMNDYYSDQVPVSDDNPRGWAKFVDKYPAELDNADAFVYAPVVETFNFGYRENKENNKLAERNDYNTYGGPMQNTAVGKLKVEAYQPTEQDKGTERALMSDTWWGTWTGDGVTGVAGKRYSYYNIFLNFEALDVPEGYELYKVRAWRKIDKKDLGELLPTRRAVRIGNIDENGWYMYEDMNFGDQLDLRETPARMSCNELSKNTILLGERSSKIAKPMNPGDETAQPLFETETSTSADGTPVVVEHEFRATFGARRLNVPGEDNGFDKLVADFKVRAYFTRGDNPLIGGASSSNAPRRAGAELTPADYDYYIAEGECHFEQLGGSGVITGITGVKSDLNREVMDVNYVNTMGQVANRPWQGVNVVVTRYTDGTTKTTKAVY